MNNHKHKWIRNRLADLVWWQCAICKTTRWDDE